LKDVGTFTSDHAISVIRPKQRILKQDGESVIGARVRELILTPITDTLAVVTTTGVARTVMAKA
jgi:hypothetical protein